MAEIGEGSLPNAEIKPPTETSPTREAGIKIFDHFVASPQKSDISFLRQVANPSADIAESPDIPSQVAEALKMRDRLRSAFLEEFPDAYQPGEALEARVSNEIEAIADTAERFWWEKDPKAYQISEAERLEAQAEELDRINDEVVKNIQQDHAREMNAAFLINGSEGPRLDAQSHRQAAANWDFLLESFRGKFVVVTPQGPLTDQVFDDNPSATQYLEDNNLARDHGIIVEVVDQMREPLENRLDKMDPKDGGFLTNEEREHRNDPIEIPQGTTEVSQSDLDELEAMFAAMNPRNQPQE